MEPRFPAPGTVVVGKYAVEALIGEGGMGAVVRSSSRWRVAIKCLLPELLGRADIVARFMREARAAVKLKGEHAARVLDVGRLETGAPYIVMEYLEGTDLSAMLHQQGPLRPALAADLMIQACEALAEAHALGIIHRDIKGSNCFVTRSFGGAPVLKLLDFGIATAPEGDASRLTTTDTVVGTPGYMAPEQMRAALITDERSDIWALGVLLYELLEGARPFREATYSALCLAIAMDPPVPMQRAPAAMHPVVMRCLEKQPDQRYQTVAQLAQDLAAFASDPAAGRAGAEHCVRLLRRSSLRGSRPAIQPAPGPEPIPAGPEPVAASPAPIPASPAPILARPAPIPASPAPIPAPAEPVSAAATATATIVDSPEPHPRHRLALWFVAAAAVGLALALALVARHALSPKRPATVPGEPAAPAPSSTKEPR